MSPAAVPPQPVLDDDYDDPALLFASSKKPPVAPPAAAPVAAPASTPSVEAGLPAVMPFDQMQANPENPRSTHLEITEAAADMATRGQLQNANIMTRAAFLAQKPHLAERVTDAPYVVINGCRRLAAGPKSGLPGLKYELRDDWTENEIDEAMISENEQRVDLNMMLLGRHLARMLPRYCSPDGKPSRRQLAKRLNKPRQWVDQRIGLTELHPDLQTALEEDRVPFKVARECIRLHPELQSQLADGALPVEVARAWLVELRLPPKEQLARWEAGPPYDVGGYPVATQQEPANEPDEPTADQPDQPKPVRAKPAIVIRLTERSPVMLADALREQLTEDEVGELVQALTSR